MKRLCALLAVLMVPLAPGCDKPTPVAPEGATLTITANPSKIALDGSSSITILARKMDGTPVNDGTEISLSTNLGTIEELVRTDAGGVAKATLTGDGRVGMATVQAFSGAAGEAMIDVTIGGLAAFLEVSASPLQIPRGGGMTNLLAVARDVDGTALAGAFISFRSEIGLLESEGAPLQAGDAGEVTDTLTVTREEMGVLVEPFFLVTAKTSGEGGVQIEESIEIEIGGQPVTVNFQATPTTILASGGEVRLQATVLDGNFDPLPDISVFFRTDIGSLDSEGSSRMTDAAGEARDILTATEGDLTAFGGGSFTVGVQTGGVGGLVIERSATIRVQTEIPVARFSIDPIFNDCEAFLFDPGASSGTAPLTCAWDFGDGTSSGSGPCSVVSHDYGEGSTGNRNVTLTVSNSQGSDPDTQPLNLPHGEGDNCPP